MADAAKHKLVDISIREVSGVDRPANKRHFLLVKSTEGAEGMSNEAAATTGEATTDEKQGGFLTRMVAGLASLFKADGQTFAENLAQEQMNDRFWDAVHALKEAIRNTLAATDLNTAAKASSIGTSLAQFQEFILGLVTSATGATIKREDLLALAKAGAKMSAARREKLQAAYETIGQILSEVAEEQVEKEGETVSNEQLQAITKRLDETAETLKKLDGLEELTKKIDALKEQNEALVKRIEELEKAPGTRKSADGQDDSGKKESFWKGVL